MSWTARCGQCRGLGLRMFVAQDLNQRMTSERFPYFRCIRCGLVFLDPMPRNLAAYYPDSYHQIPKTLDELAVGEMHERYKLEAIGADGRGRTLLEIGPSFGKFAYLAKRSGFQVSAIEMDASCCRFLREVVGLTVHQSDDVFATLESLGRYDAIVLWHSIEHLPDPWPVLGAVARHLNPGGVVAIAAPNPRAIQFRIFGKHWVHLDAPRHVMLIPHDVIERRLSASGLRRIHFTTTDQGARDCNGMSWIHTPPRRFPPWAFGDLVEPVRRRLSFRARRYELTDPNGSAYTIVYRQDRDMADPVAVRAHA